MQLEEAKVASKTAEKLAHRVSSVLGCSPVHNSHPAPTISPMEQQINIKGNILPQKPLLAFKTPTPHKPKKYNLNIDLSPKELI